MTIEGAIYELCVMNDSPEIPGYFKPVITKIIETIEMDGRPKRGRWIYKDTWSVFECSCCGRTMVRNSYFYCPWCGAKMDEVD